MLPKDQFTHWNQIRAGLIEIINQFDDQDLNYQPHQASWTVGRIMLHIASAEEGWFCYVIKRELNGWPEDFTQVNYTDKKSILDALEKVHQKTQNYLDTLVEQDLSTIIKTPWEAEIPLMWIIWHVIEHEIHHRGELSLLLGILGKEGLDV